MLSLIPLLATIFFSLVSSSDSSNSPLLHPSVVSSPAFITMDQFTQAVNASFPFLPSAKSGNFTSNKYQLVYPDMMNYAVMLGNITTTNELAMYLANVLYQSNGLRLSYDPACEDPQSGNCLGLNLNTTVFGTNVNYYGRGYLWIQGQSMYSDLANDMFGNDATLLLYPDLIRISPTMNWASTAWFWRRYIQPYMNTFGSTVKLMRPSQCNGSVTLPTPELQAAWNIYAAILSVLSPTTGPSSSYC